MHDLNTVQLLLSGSALIPLLTSFGYAARRTSVDFSYSRENGLRLTLTTKGRGQKPKEPPSE